MATPDEHTGDVCVCITVADQDASTGQPSGAARRLRWGGLLAVLGAAAALATLCVVFLPAAALHPAHLKSAVSSLVRPVTEVARMLHQLAGEHETRAAPLPQMGVGAFVASAAMNAAAEPPELPLFDVLVKVTPLRVVRDIPIFDPTATPGVEDGGEKPWIVLFSSTGDAAELSMAKYTKHVEGRGQVLSNGSPGQGGLAFVVVNCTIAELSEQLEACTECSGASGVKLVEASVPHVALQVPWGLDRIDQRNGTDGKYTPIGMGYGVHVYVLDTGIRTDHVDFEGRAVPTLDTTGGTEVVCEPTDTSCALDRQGHGTHCAATVGGKRFGVAKGVTLHAVKVLGDDGVGSSVGMELALNWLLVHAERPAVISVSHSAPGLRSVAEGLAIQEAVRQGIPVVVAAGNDAGDACNSTPAYVAWTISAAASALVGDGRDSRAPFSNVGSCVDILAPGVKILSAGVESAEATKVLSGTSTAAAHVAGAAALLLAEDPSRSPLEVKDLLLARASTRALRNPGTSVGPGGSLWKNIDALVYVGPGEKTAVLYTEQCGNGSLALRPGRYSAESLGSLGFRGGAAMSISVPRGLWVRLYDEDLFGGRRLDLVRSATSLTLDSYAFNGVTSSVVVEECVTLFEGADYQGQWTAAVMGKWTLPSDANTSIHSARVPLGYQAVFYEGSDFAGRSVTLIEDATLAGGGFTQQPGSLVVSKVALLYTHDHYLSDKYAFPAGEYPTLNRTMDNQFTSVYFVPGVRVTLFEEAHFGGRSVVLTAPVPDFPSRRGFSGFSFNNLASSLKVELLW